MNNPEVLRDHTGRMIGKIYHERNGRQVLRDHTGRLLGTYDPGTNTTRDHTGRLTGKGNLLPTLLK